MSNSSITVRKNGKLGMDKEDEKDHQAIQIQNMLFFSQKKTFRNGQEHNEDSASLFRLLQTKHDGIIYKI